MTAAHFRISVEVESSNQIPDGDTIGRFRNLLIQNHIHEQFFAVVLKTLTDRGLILKKGTIVDSTIISAPSSTKNKEKKRDPDAHSVKKGTTWYFGYKAHIGVDKDSGLVHHVEVTSANVHDVEMTPKLMTGDESRNIRRQRIYRSGKAAGCHHSEQAGQKNQVQAESQANTDQEAVRERTMESKEGGASEIICQGKSRARICGHKGAVPVSKNAIPRSAKADRQTEYAVRAGELGSG